MSLLSTLYAESGKTDLKSSKNVKNGEPIICRISRPRISGGTRLMIRTDRRLT